MARFAAVRDLLARRGALVSPTPVPEDPPGAAPIPSGPGALPTGFADLDALLHGGFPRGAVSEVLGAASCGKTTLVVSALAAATRAGGFVAFVDPAGEAYPPAMARAGVVLERLLYVRLRPENGEGDRASALWAAEVLLQSGAFDAVALDTALLPPPRAGDRKAVVLRTLAETHGAALLVLGAASLGISPGLRLRVTTRHRPGGGERQVEITVEKSRAGQIGESTDLVLTPIETRAPRP